MLKRLLSIVAKRGTITTRDVSLELDISEDIATQLFFELTRHGYLAAIGKEGASSCGHCASRDACIQVKTPALWRLTQKGELAAKTARWNE
jgi:hypothetical protein